MSNMSNELGKLCKVVFFAGLVFVVNGCSYQQPDYLKMIASSELNDIMEAGNIFLVDVHTPRQRHIKGTDLFIPYNKVEQYLDKLPTDKSAPIYLYCEGGPMGNAAARTLHDLGYQDLINLRGGARAWAKAGYEFE